MLWVLLPWMGWRPETGANSSVVMPIWRAAGRSDQNTTYTKGITHEETVHAGCCRLCLRFFLARWLCPKAAETSGGTVVNASTSAPAPKAAAQKSTAKKKTTKKTAQKK